MRQLIAILGFLAMLVTLSGPIAALAATPCHEVSMVKMAMADDAAPCKAADKACAEPCLDATHCKSQCGSIMVFLHADPDNRALPPLAAKLHVASSEQPTGTTSPVDGPPPRI
jgi:hypothetical protein